MVPDLVFASGFIDNGYVREAVQRGRLPKQTESINFVMYPLAEDAMARLNLEPLRDLRVALTRGYHTNKVMRTWYMSEGTPETYSGNFTAGIIGPKGFFASVNAGNGHKAGTFDNLLNYQQEMMQRLIDQCSVVAGADVPGARPSGPGVLTPASITAYTVRGLDGTTPFRSIWYTLPNWNTPHTGLIKIPAPADLFRNFSLFHAYRNSYGMTNYNFLISW